MKYKYLILSYLILSYLILSYLILSYLIKRIVQHFQYFLYISGVDPIWRSLPYITYSIIIKVDDIPTRNIDLKSACVIRFFLPTVLHTLAHHNSTVIAGSGHGENIQQKVTKKTHLKSYVKIVKDTYRG